MLKLFPPKRLIFLFLLILTPAFFPHESSRVRAFIDHERIKALEEAETEALALGRLWNRSSIDRAIYNFLNAAENWKTEKNKTKAAFCLREAGQLWMLLGDKEKAEQFYREALSISGSETGSLGEKSKTLSQMSILALDKGQMSESLYYLKKALKEARRSQNASAQAMAFFAEGEFYYFRNDVSKSLDSYLKSIQLWQATGDVPGEARSLLALGYLYLIKSEYGVALETLQNALEKFREKEDLRGEALTLRAIGTIYNHLNENQKALDFFRKAEQLFPEDIDLSEKASLYNWFGKAFEDYGEWHLSFIYREKALRLFEMDRHLYGQLATLPSLGKLSHLKGDDDAAIDYLKRGRQLAQQINDRFYLASINEEISNIYFKNADYHNALSHCTKALSLYQKDIYQKQIARVLNTVGRIYQLQNQRTAAKNKYLLALQLNRKIKDKFGEAETLYNLAALDELPESLDYVRESINLTESLYSEVLNAKLKSTYFSNVFDRYRLYINLLMKMHRIRPEENYAALALQAAEKSRARQMLENLSLSQAGFVKDVSPELLQREKEIRVQLGAKADKLTELLSVNADRSATNSISGEIRQLEHQLEEFNADLKQLSPAYAAIKNPPDFDVAKFQERVLDENTLLLEFSFGTEESYLWAVGKNKIYSIVLPAGQQIEMKIEFLRRTLAERGIRENESVEDYQTRLAKAEETFSEQSRILSRELFGEVREIIAGKRLIIVADGKLHYFPVAALPFPNSSSDQPFLLTNEIVYEPSASTLLMLEAKADRNSPAVKNLLVFSDPVFSQDDARLSSRQIFSETIPVAASAEGWRFVESLDTLRRLPASKAEGEAILEVIGTSGATIYSGFEANRNHVLSENISAYRIVHFATHGLIDEKHAELSGIVLSRFDAEGRKTDELVRLRDIYNLRLTAALVVLSACNTGVGKEIKGEGLLSLNNGFIQAGAKSVMSSLWKVDDYATLELMKNFYSALVKKNLPPSSALREAQIKMRQNTRYQSPFYWAAFTVHGDFRRPLDLAPRPNYSVYFWGAFSIIFLLGIYTLFRFRRPNL